MTEVRRAAGPAPDRPLVFEELERGMRFRSGSHRMTTEEILAFAGAYDPQPFHTDAERAKESLFGRLVASGWHTAAVTMRLFVEAVPIAGGLVGAGVREISWPRPVLPEDELSVTATIEELRPSRSRPEIGLASLRVETFKQNGDIVQIMKPQLVVPRRAAAAAD